MKQPFNVNGNIEICKDGKCFLNARRVELLIRVDACGSINAASKDLKMSYQQAWHFIKDMNEISPLPMIVKSRGGSSGGGTQLTDFGKRAIEEYKRVIVAMNDFTEEQTTRIEFCIF